MRLSSKWSLILLQEPNKVLRSDRWDGAHHQPQQNWSDSTLTEQNKSKITNRLDSTADEFAAGSEKAMDYFQLHPQVLSLSAHTALFLGSFEVHWSSSQSLNSWECFGSSDANSGLPILPMMLHWLAVCGAERQKLTGCVKVSGVLENRLNIPKRAAGICLRSVYVCTRRSAQREFHETAVTD